MERSGGQGNVPLTRHLGPLAAMNTAFSTLDYPNMYAYVDQTIPYRTMDTPALVP